MRALVDGFTGALVCFRIGCQVAHGGRPALKHFEGTTWVCPCCGQTFTEPADLAVERVARALEARPFRSRIRARHVGC